MCVVHCEIILFEWVTEFSSPSEAFDCDIDRFASRALYPWIARFVDSSLTMSYLSYPVCQSRHSNRLSAPLNLTAHSDVYFFIFHLYSNVVVISIKTTFDRYNNNWEYLIINNIHSFVHIHSLLFKLYTWFFSFLQFFYSKTIEQHSHESYGKKWPHWFNLM